MRRKSLALAAGWLLPLGILLLASALRFHKLGAQSLWYDEGVAYAHSLRSLPELLPLLQRNVHLPAYFALLGWWQDLTGSSEFALRALSALFSVLSVAFAYALGKRLARHPGAGLAAAALVALNSFSVYYAQEARMYAMLAALAGGSMWLCLDLMRGGRQWRAAMALGIVNALGMYTHVAFALVILSQAVVSLLWLAGRWRAGMGARLAALALAHGLSLLLFLPWLPVSLRQILAQPNLSQALDASDLLPLLLGALTYGITVEPALPGLALVAFLCLLPVLRRGRGRVWMPLLWTLISLGIYVALGLTTRYVRFLLPAQLGMALWLGMGIASLWRLPLSRARLPRLAAVAAMAALLLPMLTGLGRLYSDKAFQRDDVRGLVAKIEAELQAGHALIVSAPGLEEVLRYYYSADAPVYALPQSQDAQATRAQAQDIIARHQRLHVILYGAAEQDPELVVETTLNLSAFEIFDSWADDLRYLQYASPAPATVVKPVDLAFGDSIRLRAYALSETRLAAGDLLQVRLDWHAIDQPSQRYKVFLQLLNAQGELVAQRDSEPAGGSALTSGWQPGEIISDRHGLLIPADLPAGEYRLIAGLYDMQDAGARLPVGDGSYVELGVVTLADRESL